MAQKKKREISPNGKAFITAGFNNTIITLTNIKGEVVCWASSGTAGFKGTRKATPFAASNAAAKAAQKAVALGLKEVEIFVKGPGSGRDAAVKSLRSGGLLVRSITDVTPIPHNGTRPKGRRRV